MPAILVLSCVQLALAFSPRSSFNGRPSLIARQPRSSCAQLVMRDRSATVWFSVGDLVQVVDHVEKQKFDLFGRTGTVAETWEKCEVDPTCCCAEQVETDMAVRVRFEGKPEAQDDSGDTFDHYFAERELLKLPSTTDSQPASAAFDGMSCVAFKLDNLSQAGQKPRGIYSFDPSEETQK